MLSTLEKVYEATLTRLKEEVESEMNEALNEFRAGRATINITFITKQLIKRCMESTDFFLICFIGISKAFNTINKNDTENPKEKKSQ